MIPLSQGLVAIVSRQDYAELSRHKWTASRAHGRKFVAMRTAVVRGRRRTVYMHRQILGLDHGDPREADHRNHDTLDNRRRNLRIVSAAANKLHQPSRGGSSRFVGVTWDKPRKKWRAQVQLNGKVQNLGRYASEVEAAAARDAWVRANRTGHTVNVVG